VEVGEERVSLSTVGMHDDEACLSCSSRCHSQAILIRCEPQVALSDNIQEDEVCFVAQGIIDSADINEIESDLSRRKALEQRHISSFL
jgi:hypothetical protein